MYVADIATLEAMVFLECIESAQSVVCIEKKSYLCTRDEVSLG